MKKSGDDGTIPQPAFCIPAWPRDAPSPGGDCGSAQRRDEGGVKYRIPRSAIEVPNHQHLRACLETTRGAAARDFGCGQGGLGGAQRPAAGCQERANAGHGQKTRRPEGFRGKGRPASLLLSRRSTRDILLRRACHPAFSPKTAPLVVSKPALSQLPSNTLPAVASEFVVTALR